MKAIYCLLVISLFGWASSDHAWKNGKTYHYAVRGRVMNGLTEISTQFAGLEMDYKVILTVVAPNVVNFKPVDYKFFEVNDVIKGGWRDGELKNEHPVEINEEIRQYLESPMEVTFNHGVVESIKVQGNLPEYIINMKKAQASDFVLDTTGVNLSLEGNLNRKTGHEIPEERNLESGFFYHTLEKTIHGECETYYTVSQNGAFNEPMPFHQQHQPRVPIHDDEIPEEHTINDKEFIGELPWHTTFHNFCQEKDQIFEIIKTVNFTSCKNKPVLSFMAPSMSLGARSGDNHFAGSVGLRTLISRVLACGKSREEFTVLKIRQEELVKVGLHATKKIISGAIKNFTLFQVVDSVSPVLIQNPKVINNLFYKFVQQNNQVKTMEETMELPQMDAAYMMNFGESAEETKTQIVEDEPTVLPKPTLTEAPVNSFLITPLKVDGLKKRVVDLVKEIVQDLLNKNFDAEKETLSKISTVSKILRYLPYTAIEELYRQVAVKYQTEEDKTARQVFLDAVAIAGTNPNVKFLLDYIQKKEITGDTVSQILMTLPMYIRTPTLELLKEYFNLLQSDVVLANKQAKTTAILSFSTILYEACIDTKIRSTRYPIAVYGNFCDAQVVEQEFLPYFVKELERIINTPTQENVENTHWKLVFLTAVGNIGHPSVLPLLQRYMDNVQSTIVKIQVISALKHMIIARSDYEKQESNNVIVDRETNDVLTKKIVQNKVMPILLAAAFDNGEHPDVRMTAITLIFHSSAADKAIYQQLAYLTWFPVSRQVHSFIYHSLKSMANLDRPVHPVHYKMQTLARQVLTLCKPITVGYQSSRMLVQADQITEFLSGYFSHFEYFGSRDSIVPNMIYYRNFYQFGGEHGLGVNGFQFEFYGNTMQKLINLFTKQFITPSEAGQEAHEDLNKINELLGVKDRKQLEAVEGYFYLKIRDEMERFITVNKEVIEQWTKNIMSDILPKLHQGLPINFQKTLRLAEYTQEMPTIFGLPLNYKHRMPVFFSLRGNVKLATAENNKDFQIQLELQPVYAWKTHDKLSIKVPFLNKKYETGLVNHMVAQFPLRALIRKAPRNQITIAITPTHIQETTPSSEIKLITVHRVPYTAIIVDELWNLFHDQVGEVKKVRVLETPYKNEKQYGVKQFGLAFHLQEESDYTVEAEGKNQWINFFTRFNTLSGYFNLGWLGAPSTRYVKRTLSLDVAQSQTKTFAVVFGGNFLWNNKNVNVETIPNETVEEHHIQDRVGKVHNFAAAFIGKKTPIRPLTTTTGIQKILVKGTPSTFHYFAHFEYLNAVHGKFNLRLVSGEACREAVAKLPVNLPAFVAIKEYIVESHVEGQQVNGCFELLNLWEVPTWANPQELVILRKRLLAQDLVLKQNTEVHMGPTCNQMPHQIKIKGLWKRNEKMTEYARTKSPQAKKCIEDEKKGFQVSPVCLFVAEQQAAALNVADFDIEYTENIPVWFKNVTYKFEDFLKATLYTYMEHNRFPESGLLADKKMKFHFELTPNKEFITFKVYKPTGLVEFRNVKLAPFAKKFLPLTATQNPLENIQDRTFQFYSEQSCTLEGKYVSTFDNVTFSFGEKVAPGCTHLLTKDCTGKYPLAVLVKDIHTERKTVTILLGGKTKIIITPTTAFMGLRQGNFKVQVNQEVVQTFPKVILHQHTNAFIAIIEVMVNGGIQVRTPKIKVATDGAKVILYGHNAYKSRTCGICGNADYENNAEMRSPKNCPLSSGNLLVASYAFDSLNAEEKHGQCQVQPEIKARIEKENADCLKQSNYIIKSAIKNVETTSSEEYNADTLNDDCNVRTRISKRFPGVGVCYAEKPVQQCNQGCYAKNTVEKEVEFKCFNKSNPTPFTKYVMKQMTMEVPTLCVRA